MSGTKAGSAKAKATIREKYGVDADGKSLKLKEAGSKGGKSGTHIRGFALMPRELRSAYGAKGGKKSRKPKKTVDITL